MCVRVDIGARRKVGLGVFDLLIDRVGIDHDAHGAAQVLLAQLRRATQIDQRVGLGVERPHGFAGKPVIDVVDRIPIGPPLAKAVPLQRGAQVAQIIGAIHDDAADARIVGVGAMVLDIPGLEAELLQRCQIMHSLPGDPGEGHLADEVQENDLAASLHGIRLFRGVGR